MENIFNKLVIDHFGISIFIMIVIAVAVIKIITLCYKIYYKTKRADNLPCVEHQNKIEKHENSLIKQETSIQYITKSLEMLEKEAQRRNTLINPYTQAHSPLSITKEGYEMIKRLDVMQKFNNNWDRIKKLIDEGVEEKNVYDIDRFCIEQAVVYPEKFLLPNELLPLKEDAYKNGLTLTPYMNVIAVLSRDRYIKERNITMTT